MAEQKRRTPQEQEEFESNRQERAERLAKEQREAELTRRAGRGPASSLKYGKQEDRRAEERGDRPLPGMAREGTAAVLSTMIARTEGGVVPRGIVARGGGGELIIPARQKDSPIKREFERMQRLTPEQAVAMYMQQGYDRKTAERRSGELLDRYNKRELTRADLDLIASRPQKAAAGGSGVIVRKGKPGKKARKGSEVAREARLMEMKTRRLVREDDQRGRGLPGVLTRTGRSVFSPEEGSFDPGRAGSKRKGGLGANLTRAQEKALIEARRAERARIKQEESYQRFRRNYAPLTKEQQAREEAAGRSKTLETYRSVDPGRGGWRRSEQPEEIERKMREASAASERERQQQIEEFKRSLKNPDIGERNRAVVTSTGVRIIRGGRRSMSGLGALDTTTTILGALMIGAIGLGAVMVLRTVQASK